MSQSRYRRRSTPRARQLRERAPSSETISKLREFFEISSSKCSCCGEIHPLPADYGVTDEASWGRRMDEYLAWARANKEAVLAALPYIGREWRESCEALRQVLEAS
jgi:hypothetical protein